MKTWPERISNKELWRRIGQKPTTDTIKYKLATLRISQFFNFPVSFRKNMWKHSFSIVFLRLDKNEHPSFYLDRYRLKHNTTLVRLSSILLCKLHLVSSAAFLRVKFSSQDRSTWNVLHAKWIAAIPLQNLKLSFRPSSICWEYPRFVTLCEFSLQSSFPEKGIGLVTFKVVSLLSACRSLGVNTQRRSHGRTGLHDVQKSAKSK